MRHKDDEIAAMPLLRQFDVNVAEHSVFNAVPAGLAGLEQPLSLAVAAM